jgi:hypothetical protein
MPVKVLLAEADDSTRHVISALLRKCGYHGAHLILLAFWDFALPADFRTSGLERRAVSCTTMGRMDHRWWVGWSHGVVFFAGLGRSNEFCPVKSA